MAAGILKDSDCSPKERTRGSLLAGLERAIGQWPGIAECRLHKAHTDLTLRVSAKLANPYLDFLHRRECSQLEFAEEKLLFDALLDPGVKSYTKARLGSDIAQGVIGCRNTAAASSYEAKLAILVWQPCD
jgi:hypothetical protein